MRIWIDAEQVTSSQRVFGLSTLERILWSIGKMSDPVVEVVVSGQLSQPAGNGTYTVLNDSGPAGQRLSAYLASADQPVLALDGGSVVDARLLPLLLSGSDAAFLMAGEGNKKTAIVRLSPAVSVPEDATSIREIAEHLCADGSAREIAPGELPDFVSNLRRHVPFTLEAITDEKDRAEFEKRLFHLNYKGSTDFMTKWVYPPIVWRLVQLSVKWRIHPNWITILSIALAIVAVPLFAQGHWISGLIAGYGMTILDSVDGKVARLTQTDSPIGNVMDHGLDIVHPPFWYAAWAWGLGARGPEDVLYVATAWLIFFYIADRLALAVAKKRFKRGLHAVTPLDGMVRTWIARRNVNLVVFTIGLALGQGPAALILIAVWQGMTFGWHALRTAWLYPRARHEPYLS